VLRSVSASHLNLHIILSAIPVDRMSGVVGPYFHAKWSALSSFVGAEPLESQSEGGFFLKNEVLTTAKLADITKQSQDDYHSE
jgi:hypothetical protein